MFDFDKWQEIFNTIKKHKLRTFLTALGVFWGVFMLVTLMGAGQGLENGVTGLFGGHATNSMYAGGSKTSKPYKGRKPGRWIQLTVADMEAIESRFEDKIEYLSPRMWMPSGEVTRGDRKGAFETRGDTPDLIHIDAFTIIDGRFLNQLDMNRRRKVAVIGKRVREVLFDEDEDPLGQSIEIKGSKYQVVGVAKSDSRGNDGKEDDETIFIPLTTAQQIMNRPKNIGWFVCSMYENVMVSEVEDDLVALLKERHTIAPDDPRGIWSDNVEEQFREINGLFFGIKFLVWFVGIGSLLAGVIGVGNIMLIVVKERTKEIGIRKALGATPISIISMVLMESVFVTTLAGYFGLAAGTGVVYLMNLAVGEDGGQFYANPEVDLRVGVIALIILIISGAITGLIPAMQAANVNPVEALKDE